MPGKLFYRLLKKEGIGPRISEDGILRESYSSTELEEAGVTEKELLVNRLADCGCVVSGQETGVCSCGRVVCLRHAVICGGNVVCLQCCPAGGKPDFFVCLSCGIRNSIRRLISGRKKTGKKSALEVIRKERNGNV